MDSDRREFATRFLSELKSYAPIALPTLIIYTLESASSLKLWHAVQQTSYVAPEPSLDGSGVSGTTVVDKVVKKAGRRSTIENLLFLLVLILIVGVGQFMSINGGDAVGIDFHESISENTNWYDLYYAVTLFFPVVFLNARAISMLCGVTSRIVFRNAEGAPFIIISRREGQLGHRFFIVLLSVLTAVGTVWIRNSICVAIFYASMVHFMVSTIALYKVVTMKQQFIGVLALLLVAVSIFGMSFVPGSEGLPQGLFDTLSSSEVNWPALIYSAIWTTSPFLLISLFYRLDHALARPDELLVGPPSVEGIIAGAEQLRGTRITYSFPKIKSASSVATFAEPFAKPYFHAALGGWCSAHVLLAVLRSTDQIVYAPEIAGMYLLYTSMPLIALKVLTVAAVRGELRRVFAYKEEWTRKPVADNADSVVGADKDLGAKDSLYVSEKNGLNV